MKFAQAFTNLLWGRMLRVRSGPGDADRTQRLLELARGASPPAATPKWNVRQTLSCLNFPDPTDLARVGRLPEPIGLTGASGDRLGRVSPRDHAHLPHSYPQTLQKPPQACVSAA